MIINDILQSQLVGYFSGTSDTSDTSDTSGTSTTAKSSDASKTSASVTRLSSYFITFSFFVQLSLGTWEEAIKQFYGSILRSKHW